MSATALPPVVAIDGPAASGKGTVAEGVAQALGFRYLDSGALYRLVALEALAARVAAEDAPSLERIAAALAPEFAGARVGIGGRDVTDDLRDEAVSAMASRVAVHPTVRQALLVKQRAFRLPPGLVAEGRDMGSIVFPDAVVKLFLTASAEARAGRRHKQLIEKGISAKINDLLREIRDRDTRDSTRAVAPLVAAADAVVLDSTGLDVAAVTDTVVALYRGRH